MEKTLSLLKPDALERNLTGCINALMEKSGLKIIGQKMLALSLDQVKAFYAIHKDKVFFSDLCKNMMTGPIIAQVLQGDKAVNVYRKLMGATDPKQAEEGTIRQLYGLSLDHNTVHGSDSFENAEKEIRFFFSEFEIFPQAIG